MSTRYDGDLRLYENEDPCLVCAVSSRQVTAKWRFLRAFRRSEYRVTLYNLTRNHPAGQIYTGSDYYTFALEEGDWYELEVELLHSNGSGRRVAREYVTFKAVFSKSELDKLDQMGQNIINASNYNFPSKPQSIEITHFHRTLPDEHWEDARRDRVIYKKKQGRTGHPASSIINNERVKGVYVATNLDSDGQFPRSSPFGDRRFRVPCGRLFDPDRDNLYFSLLSCFQGNLQLHYVTLLICRKGSEVDRFGARRLKRLNPYDNRYLWIKHDEQTSEPLYFITNHIYVNVMYTDNIPLEWGRFDGTKVEYKKGNSSYKLGYHPNCQWCDPHHPANN